MLNDIWTKNVFIFIEFGKKYELIDNLFKYSNEYRAIKRHLFMSAKAQ